MSLKNFFKILTFTPPTPPTNLSNAEMIKWYEEKTAELEKMNEKMEKVSKVTDVFFVVVLAFLFTMKILHNEFLSAMWITQVFLWFALYRISMYHDRKNQDRMVAVIKDYRSLIDEMMLALEKAMKQRDEYLMLLKVQSVDKKKGVKS